MYQRATNMLDPQWKLAEENERTGLANRGFQEGTTGGGFGTAMDAFQRQKGLQYQNARDSAIAAGTQVDLEQRRQAMAEAVASQSPAGYTGTGVPILPGAQAGYEGALTGYGIQNAQKNALMGGLFGLGGNYLLGSMLGGGGSSAGGGAGLAGMGGDLFGSAGAGDLIPVAASMA
jgi:hypothetical protein